MASAEVFDVAVIGGGPSGATAANDLARRGHSVVLIDKAGRIKPCGGAIPPKLVDDFGIPNDLLVTRITGARIVSPKKRSVDMPIDGGYVGMVDRDVFDEWLRRRAALNGAERLSGVVQRIDQNNDGSSTILFRAKGAELVAPLKAVRARSIIGADGALSAVARQCVPGADRVPYVFAYHEIIRTPSARQADYDPSRCDVYYNGRMSPDFYSWVFPHGATMSIGTGSAHKGFSLRSAVAELRALTGLHDAETVRREGAPIPLRPLKRWDDGRSVLLAGDAAGVVAPASGEGIYYAMLGGRLAADATEEFVRTGDARALRQARRRFMRVHGPVFWILGIMQTYWYRNDDRRERFVRICNDQDVQTLTWDAYMNKELIKARPLAHVRIFFKNLAHLTGVVSA